MTGGQSQWNRSLPHIVSTAQTARRLERDIQVYLTVTIEDPVIRSFPDQIEEVVALVFAEEVPQPFDGGVVDAAK